MKNNNNFLRVACLAACIMSLVGIDYSHMQILDIAVIIAASVACIAVVSNIVISRRKG